MSVAFGSSGAVASGATALSVPYPSGIAADNLLVLLVASKYPSAAPSTPAGWTLLGSTNGVAAVPGNDAGQVTITAFGKAADGTETGSLSLSVPSADCAIARMLRYTKAANKLWSVDYVAETMGLPGTGWSVTLSSAGFFTYGAGSIFLAASAINTDARTFSGERLRQTGATFGTVTERQDSGTNQGQDCALVVSEHPMTAPGSGDFTFDMTASGSNANNPAGVTALIVLAEAPLPLIRHTKDQTGVASITV